MELQKIKYQKSYVTGRETIEYALTTNRDERNSLVALLCEASLIAARLARHDRRPHPPAATYNAAVKDLAEVFKTIRTDEASTQIEERYRWVLQSAAALTLNIEPAKSNPIAARVAEKFRLPLAENPMPDLPPQADVEGLIPEPGAAMPEIPMQRIDQQPVQNFDPA